MDFGDIRDKNVQDKLSALHNSVNNIEVMLEKLRAANIYEQLSLKEKVDYDLFIAYALNTLFWLYLRTKNEDPNKNDVKVQLNRVKGYMIKAKQAHESNTIRPKINQAAAGRFIRHGIKYKKSGEDGGALNKKIKFSD